MLGQWKVADKSNEITAVPELLRVLELAGCIVTVDAMECQKTIAKEIKEADADYLMALKGNQEAVYDEVKAFLDAAVCEQSAPRPVARNSRWARGGAGTLGRGEQSPLGAGRMVSGRSKPRAPDTPQRIRPRCGDSP